MTAGPEAFLVVLGGRRTPLILWRLGHGTLLREAIAHLCERAPGRETRRLGASLGG